jgi:hypothetical protein
LEVVVKKAIQTEWKGYKFRSRLEARWAVYFEAVGLEWEYEPEGFVLKDGSWYLPDFYLPTIEAWVEIKPKNGSRADVFEKLKLMMESGVSGKHKAWVFFGDPVDHHWMLPVFSTRKSKGNWVEEWGEMTAFSVEKIDGRLTELATFSLSTYDFIKKNGHLVEGSKPHDLISDYKFKVIARSARFEHGDTPE